MCLLEKKLKLYGFNNLTKTLSFNIYDVCYAKGAREQKEYIDYIDEQYNSERLTGILCDVTDIIGANVLNISKQDYDPQGASVTLLISEKATDSMEIDKSCNRGMVDGKPLHPQRNGAGKALSSETVVAHLDKSHVTVHTYPEYHPNNSISTFYRVRGFTRDVGGRKLYLDHDITSIQDFINDYTLTKYDATDINVYQANIFHTRLMVREMDLKNYLFNTDIYDIPPKERLRITESLRREMIEIYSGMNIYG